MAIDVTTGQTRSLGMAGDVVNTGFNVGVVGDTIYAVGLSHAAYAIRADAITPLTFVDPSASSLAAWPGDGALLPRLAWNVSAFSGTASLSKIVMSSVIGSDVRTGVEETVEQPTALNVARWSKDGNTLYYSREPVGIGGYILFGGASSLFALDFTTGVTRTLVPFGEGGLGMICITDLSPDETQVAHVCQRDHAGLLNLTTGQTTTIDLPAQFNPADAGALGSALFSPDGTRLAYAIARHNPDNEQGWLAVSTDLRTSGDQPIVTSEPGTFVSVKSWLDNDTLVFQRSATASGTASVWSVRYDGSDAKLIAEGDFVAVVDWPADDAAGGPIEPGPALRGGVLAARQLLAQQLHVDLDQVKAVAYEPTEFPDSCLGLALPGVMCAQVITPGYVVTLEAEGQKYVFHTDDNGTNVRLAEAPPVNVNDAAIVWQHEENTGCQTATIGPDTVAFGVCGGPQAPGKFAGDVRAQAFANYVSTYASFGAMTPAGQITFTGKGSTQATPAEQRMIAEFARLAALEAAGGRSGAAYGLILAWHREGGIAGFCDDLTVYVTGDVFATSCRGNQPSELGRGRLNAAQLAQAFEWVDRLKSFEGEQSDAKPGEPMPADGMLTRLIFAGNGAAEPTESDKTMIQALASDLFASLSQGQSN